MPRPGESRQDASSRCDLGLTGVPETMLWPLWNRAIEMERREPLLQDPMSVELVQRIDYDFRGMFGRPSVFHPIRAKVCDDLIRTYLAQSASNPVVVALGEGLETQFWRIPDDRLLWLSVDLPEAIEIRRRLLPSHDRCTLVPCSALDPAWMEAVPSGATPFVALAGLLMYFEENQVRGLLSGIARRFPGAWLFFDTITPHIAAKTLRGWRITKHYEVPPMPWGIDLKDVAAFLAGIGGLETVAVQSYADPYPERTRIYQWLSHIPAIRRRYAGGLVQARVTDAGVVLPSR